jgi:pimeloyl-ACP methyl ester carboxylesterase
VAELLPFYREAGAGPGVVCLHSNASSSSQWRGLMEMLAPKFHVIAADQYGAGKSPAWAGKGLATLSDEAALLEPVLAHAGAPFTLVGHSYGAAVALITALRNPKRVRAMALYEPTLFALVEAESPQPNDADGICAAVARSVAALDGGDENAAAGHFIDYWMGAGSWARTPENRKPPIAASMRSIRSWSHALLREPTKLDAFAALDMPVLYMTGAKSPASSRGVARLLQRVLPRVDVVELDGVGHMAPVTHPDLVNGLIVRFLDRLA